MKLTLSWLKDHLETDAPLSEIVERLTSIGLEVEFGRRQGWLETLRHRKSADGAKTSRCRQAASADGGYGRRKAGSGRVRRAECARGSSRRLRRARHLHSRHRRDAVGGKNPRRRKFWHDVLGARAAAFRRAHRHHRPARGRACGGELRGLCQARRSGDRYQSDAEPPRRNQYPRHRARPRCGWAGQAEGRESGAGPRQGRLPGEGDDRSAGALPRLCAAAGARSQERAVAKVAAAKADRDRAQAHQRAGRHHQLHHLRPRPAAACLRCEEGEGRPHRAQGQGWRKGAGARRARIRAVAGDVRHRRRQTAWNRLPASWAASIRAATRRRPTS